jgi:hypothetical protein
MSSQGGLADASCGAPLVFALTQLLISADEAGWLERQIVEGCPA